MTINRIYKTEPIAMALSVVGLLLIPAFATGLIVIAGLLIVRRAKR